MYKDKTIAVVVPAYNEEGFVGEVIETIPEFVDRAYVIDDCSTDGTWDEIQRAVDRVNAATDGGTEQASAASSSRTAGGEGTVDSTVGIDSFDAIAPESAAPPVDRIVPIQHEENRGVGGAIKTGYELARDHGYDVAAVMSGDGQMDPEILPEILDPVVEGRADYAKGNRLSQRSQLEGMSAWRLFGNTTLTFLTKCVSGYWRMKDPQNGYTAISRRCLTTLDLDRLYDDYGFSNDILVHLNVHEMRVADVEMKSRYGDENSTIRYSRFIPKLSWLLARRAVWRVKAKYVVADFHPLVFLYVLGILGTGVGLLSAGWSVASAGVASVATLLSVTLTLLGSLFVTLAMIFDRIENRELERGPTGRIGGGSDDR